MVKSNLFWPDSQVKVEASLQQQILNVIWIDGEVEIQRVPQQLIRFLIALPDGQNTMQLIQLKQRSHFK